MDLPQPTQEKPGIDSVIQQRSVEKPVLMVWIPMTHTGDPQGWEFYISIITASLNCKQQKKKSKMATELPKFYMRQQADKTTQL